jgi:hypothetical protein
MTNVALKIVLLYADKPGEELGKEVARALHQKMGADFHLHPSSWNVELLRSAKLRKMAAIEARDSDMVIVAMDEGEPLSSEVQEWLSLWVNRNSTVPGALLALLKRDSHEKPRVVEAALHKFAETAKMDFFCHSEVKRETERPHFRMVTPLPAAA